MFAICADKKPNTHIYEMEDGESHDIADALAKWARRALSLTAICPADSTGDGLDAASVRASDGDWAPSKDTIESGMLLRDAE